MTGRQVQVGDDQLAVVHDSDLTVETDEVAEPVTRDSYTTAVVGLALWLVIALMMTLPIMVATWWAIDAGDDGAFEATWIAPFAVLAVAPAAAGSIHALRRGGPPAQWLAEFTTTAAVAAFLFALISIAALGVVYLTH